MQGSVFRVPQAKHGNKPHLHVVVVESVGRGECIVVPAFDKDGYAVNEVIKSRLDEFFRLDQIAVELDNAQHITFTSSHTGKQALWLVSDPDPFPIAELVTYEKIGVMDAAGLKLVAAGLFNFSGTTDRFSAAMIKKFRKLAEL